MAKLKPPTSRISISPLSWFPSFNPLSIAKYLKALLRNFLLFLQLSTLFKPRTPTSRLSFSFFLSYKTTTSSSALPIAIAFTHNKIVLKIRQKIRQIVFATLQNELRSNVARFTSHRSNLSCYLHSPQASLFRAAKAFRVTWSQRFASDASPK